MPEQLYQPTRRTRSALRRARFRLAHQELQVRHRPEGARRRSRRDAEEAHLPPRSEGTDGQPPSGGSGQTPQAIYHQIRKLTAADLVEVAREERVGHLIE